MSCKIHPTAIVEQGAELGNEVEVGAYAVIGPDVKVGDRAKIYSHVVISGRTTLGAECTVFPFASLGGVPQDLKFHGEPSELLIGEKNIIREYVTLQPGTAHGTMKTIIGDQNLFMANSHVGHDCRVGSKNVFSNSVALAGHVTIHNSVILGGLAGMHQFCHVGDYALIGAGSMVSLDVPPFCIAQGDRAHLRGVNVIGLERAGVSKEDIQEVRKTYRLLFSSPGRIKEKVANVPEELKQRPLVEKMLRFITESERGVAAPLKALSSAEAS